MEFIINSSSNESGKEAEIKKLQEYLDKQKLILLVLQNCMDKHSPIPKGYVFDEKKTVVWNVLQRNLKNTENLKKRTALKNKIEAILQDVDQHLTDFAVTQRIPEKKAKIIARESGRICSQANSLYFRCFDASEYSAIVEFSAYLLSNN